MATTLKDLSQKHEEYIKAMLEHWQWDVDNFLSDHGLNGIVVREDGVEGHLETQIENQKVKLLFYTYNEKCNRNHTPEEIVDERTVLEDHFKPWLT